MNWKKMLMGSEELPWRKRMQRLAVIVIVALLGGAYLMSLSPLVGTLLRVGLFVSIGVLLIILVRNIRHRARGVRSGRKLSYAQRLKEWWD